MPPSLIMALTPKSTWARWTILVRPCLCIWERRTSSFPSLRKLRSRRPLLASQARRSTAIRVSVTPSLGIMGRTTTPRRRRSPTGGQANFYINNCGDLRSLFQSTLRSRLPKHDIAANIGIANQRCPPLVEINNAAFRDGDRAVLLGSRVRGFNVADLEAGIVGVDVLELDRRSSLAGIHGEIA